MSMNERPATVTRALFVLWVSLALKAVIEVVLISKGFKGGLTFAVSIALLVACCAFPLKLSKGSDRTRFFYLGFVGGAAALFFAGENLGMSVIEAKAIKVFMVFDIYILMQLFGGPAEFWFTRQSEFNR